MEDDADTTARTNYSAGQQLDPQAYFTYLPEFGVLICLEHRYAVENLSRHLSKCHNKVPLAIRKAILAEYGDKRLVESGKLSLPEDGCVAFTCLRTPTVGFQCIEETCGWKTISRSVILQHCNDEHSWRSKKNDRRFWNNVRMQTFHTGSGRQRWFIVRHEQEEEERQARSMLEEHVQVELTEIERGFGRIDATRAEELQVLEEKMVKTDTTSWWKTSGWREHLKKANLVRLAHPSRLPEKKEKELYLIGLAVDGLIEQAVARLPTIPRVVRRWIRSASPTECDGRPMARLQNEDSQARYAGYWKRLIVYCVRVWLIQHDRPSEEDQNEQEEEESSTSDDSGSDEEDEGERRERRLRKKDPMYDTKRLFPWTEELKGAVQRLYELASGNNISDREELVEQRMAAILEISKLIVMQKVYGQPFKCVMVHFMAVFGIEAEQERLKDGNEFSFTVAGLVYVARVLMAEALLPAQARESEEGQAIESFLTLRREYLSDGSRSVFNEMLVLLTIGKHIARNHSNIGDILWIRDGKAVQLGSKVLEMELWKSMISKVVTECEDMLWQDLMWVHQKKDRFVIDLYSIRDDMNVRKRDYFFGKTRQLGDGTGTEGDKTMEERGISWMLGRLLSSQAGRALRVEGKWQVRMVKAYLMRMERFRRLLLFAIHTTSGQPARGTEVTSLRFRNGVGNHRNIFVSDGRVMTVTSYHKSQSQWDTPKMVPRFLPYRLGQVMVIFLTHVRAFAERLSVELGVGVGWSDYVFADKDGPWETPKLTGIIKQTTKKHMGVSMTTHEYRHAATFVGRTHVSVRFGEGFEKDLSEDAVEEVQMDDETTGDSIEFAKAGGQVTGKNRYAVDASILHHLNQDTIDVFGDLSEGWQRIWGLEAWGPVEGQGKKRLSLQEAFRRGAGDNTWSNNDDEENIDPQTPNLEQWTGRKRRRAEGLATGSDWKEVSKQQGILTSRTANMVDLTPVTGIMERMRKELEQAKMQQAELQAENRLLRMQQAGGQVTGLGISSDLVTPVRRVAGPPTPPETDQWEFECEVREERESIRPVTEAAEVIYEDEVEESPMVERREWREQQRAVQAQRRRQGRPRPTQREKVRAIRQALGMSVDGDSEEVPIKYRSKEQGQALERIFSGDFEVLTVVLPTAGGKTLLFTAPACLEEDAGVTVVVVPYRKLIDETVADAKNRMGKSQCEEWKQGWQDEVRLMVVSVDKMGQAFWLWARQMQERGSLRRVVVDECHLIVTAHSWRPVIMELKELKTLGVPLVLLTATLPGYMEGQLKSSLGLRVGMMSVIRARTTRPGITYAVRQDIEPGKLVETTVAAVEELQMEMRVGDKVVVYCRSKGQCEAVAEAIGCDYFYAGNVDNTDALKKWKKKGGCIVATTALGTGVNYRGITAVIHSGLPYGLVDFAQESGRAGRDGEEVDSLVLLEAGWEQREANIREQYHEGLSRECAAMEEFVKTTGCRREVLSEFFDGSIGDGGCNIIYEARAGLFDKDEETEVDEGEVRLKARCDRCGSGETTGRRGVIQTALERERIEEGLDEMKLGCVICWMKADNEQAHLQHSTERCSRYAGELTVKDPADGSTITDPDTFRGWIRYSGKAKACHKCGISQKICETRQDSNQACQWPGLANAVLISAAMDGVGRNIIRKAGFTNEGFEEVIEWKQYAKWCGQMREQRIWGEVMSNSMMVITEWVLYKWQERAKIFEDRHVTHTDKSSSPGHINGYSSIGEGDDGDGMSHMLDNTFEVNTSREESELSGSSMSDMVEERARVQVVEWMNGERRDMAADKRSFWGVVGRYCGCCTVCMARHGVNRCGSSNWRLCPLTRERGIVEKMEELEGWLERLPMPQAGNGCYKCGSPMVLCEGKEMGTLRLFGDRQWVRWEKGTGWCGNLMGDKEETRRQLARVAIGIMFSGQEGVMGWLIELGQEGLLTVKEGKEMALWWMERSSRGIEVEWDRYKYDGEKEQGWTECSRICELIWLWG